MTEQWKSSIILDLNYRRNRCSFKGEGEEDYINITRDSSLEGTLIKTLGSHRGGGVRASLSSSTYTNHHRLFRVSSALEHNIFPYAETTRRQLTFTHSIGVCDASHRELTLHGQLREWLTNHAFAVNWNTKQPGGPIDVQVEASQDLPDTRKNRLSLEGDVEVRLFNGFSLDIGASASIIHDEVSVPAGRATQEQVLLRLRQAATSCDYGVRIDFNYSSCSACSNVVNTRLSSCRGVRVRSAAEAVRISSSSRTCPALSSQFLIALTPRESLRATFRPAIRVLGERPERVTKSLLR